MSGKKTIKTVALVITLVSALFLTSAFAAKPIYSGGKERAAIRGYDPVNL